MVGRFCTFCIFALLTLGVNIPLFAQLFGPDQQRLADGLYARGLYDLALVEYQKLIKIQPAPDNLDLLFYRAGESALRSGQNDLARQYFNEAIQIDKTGLASQRSLYRLADEAFRAGDFRGSEKILRELTSQKPDPVMDVPARFTLGQVLESRNQSAEALTLYKALIQAYPDESLSAYAALRVAALSQGSVVQKREAYLKALKNPPSRDFEIEALWGLAALDVAEKKHKEAAASYWRLWENFQDSARVRGGMIHLAWAQLQAGEFARALTLSQATTEVRKQSDADTWLYLDALCYLKTDAPETARKSFETLLTAHSKSRFRSTVAYELAALYAAAGEHEKVIGLRAELEQMPGREGDALWMLAESARATNQTRQALQQYTRIAHQYPNHARAADAAFYKAQLLLQSGDSAAAAEALNQFATRYTEDPRAPGALEQAGDLLIQAGKMDDALRQWGQALKTYPDLPIDLWYKTALLEIKLEKFALAQGRLEMILSKQPAGATLAGSHYWLGILYEKAGEDGKAQAAFTQALSGDLKAEWQSPARMRLGQSYVRNQQPEKALGAFLPMLDTAQADGLSDNLLLWLLPIARSAENKAAVEKIARTLITEHRAEVAKELGYYALAESLNVEAQTKARMDALQKGLAFQSDTLEAAQASLQLAGIYLSQQQYTEAFTQYADATRIASLLEQGRLQARGMMGSGDVRFAEEKWADAAKYYMSVAVLFDDPVISPEALHRAADAFRRAEDTAKAAAAEKEIQTRYPELPESNQ